MPARKKSNNRINGIDVKSMLEAFEAFEEEYGISREEIARLLAESIETVVKKKHVEGLPDLMVKVNIDIDSGDISVFILKNVVEDVEDDAIEISLEDAKEIKPDAKIGDIMEFAVPLTDFGVPEVKKLKTVFVQKIKEAQKAAIYAIYKDKIDELITGTVDNIDPGKRFVSVNIGRTFVTLPRKEMIGDEIETIRPGQQLKVYLSGIGNSEQGIVVSRACPGFLKRLFEEEIRDVYDGTVIFSGPFKGYGNIIIVEHGDGYLSLLAGLGTIDCEAGQMVLAGEPVGLMPDNNNAKLYVEIRKDRHPINPAPWIAS